MAKKRNEEYIKFVIKRGFRSLFKKFKQNNNQYISGNKIEDQEQFYAYYFKTESEEKKILLDEYYLPGSQIYKIKKKTNKNRSLTHSYLTRIFQEEKFRADFLEFVEEGFLATHEKKRQKKLIKLCEKFQKQKSFHNLKLPWTNGELK